jgi:hypothetical protein
LTLHHLVIFRLRLRPRQPVLLSSCTRPSPAPPVQPRATPPSSSVHRPKSKITLSSPQLYKPPSLPSTFAPHTYLDATPLLIKKGAPKKQFALHFAFFGSLRNALGRFGVVIFDCFLNFSLHLLLAEARWWGRVFVGCLKMDALKMIFCLIMWLMSVIVSTLSTIYWA